MSTLADRLAELDALLAGWFDGDGEAPTAAALGLASVLGQALSTATQDTIRAYPTPDGGVQLEWKQDQLSHCVTIGPHGQMHLMTVDPEDAPAAPAEPQRAAATLLRQEAAAMERLQEQLAWVVVPTKPRIDAPTLRAVANLLESLEPE